MSVRIVTDSTCDLPQSVIKDLGICVIPLYIRVGDRDYLDGIDMTRDEFYRNLPLFKDHPTTAAPSPQKFKAIYDSMAEEGASEVLSIHISTTLSATYSIAVTASEETTSVPVTVYDSRQLSLGTGFQVQKAAEMARDGKNVQEIIVELDKQVARIHVWALLDTLKYLRRSGRMNPVISTIGEILQIKPILKMFNGVSAAEKVRTRKKGLARLMEMLKDLSPFERIAFLHSDAIDEAKTLQAAVRKLLPDNEIWLEIINPVLGAHIGTGVVGFACITKE
jgi:DegV family protein with EDD domain